MMRKFASAVFLLTSIVIGLGAFGHGSQWHKHVLPALGSVDAGTVRLLALIWYWVSGTMLVFGALLIWTWWRMRQGENNLRFIPLSVGTFYLLDGGYAALTLDPFFWLFVILALLLFVSTLGLRNAVRPA